MLHVILLALTPVFFVMALGFLAGRMRAIDNHHVDGINSLVMSFALPASLFAATASAPRSEMMAQTPLFAILGTVMLFVYVLWYLFQAGISGTSRGDAALQALTVAFPNIAGVGLPITMTILGRTGAVQVAVALATGSILLNPLTLLLLELSGRSGNTDANSSAAGVGWAMLHALTKPVVLAPALGILVSLSGLNLGTVATASLELIGQAAGGAALFLTGLILSAQSLRLKWHVISATGIADVIRPLLAAGIVYVFPVPPEIGKVAILMAAIPSGFFGILFAVNYRLNSQEVGSILISSTVFSIATLAITIAILFPS